MKSLRPLFSNIHKWFLTKKFACILSAALLLVLADVFYLEHQYAYKEARLEQFQTQYNVYEESLLKTQKIRNAYLPQALIKSRSALELSEMLIGLFSNKGAGLTIQELRLFNASQDNLNTDYNGQSHGTGPVASLPNTMQLHGSIDMKKIRNPYEVLNQQIKKVETRCSCKPKLTKALVDSKNEGDSPYSRLDYNIIMDLAKCAIHPSSRVTEQGAYSEGL